MQDIWEYAKGRVNNKGVLARIGHSAKLHDVRSATKTKGSAASKTIGLLGMGARAALGAIPVPVLGSILGAIQGKAQSMGKTFHHERKLAAAKSGGNLKDEVKFTLKDLSVEEMDRYRNKVEMAMNDFNKAIAQFEGQVTKYRTKGATCDAYLELAKAGEQASRRFRILRDQCINVAMAMGMTMQWANKLEFGTVANNAPPPPPPPGNPGPGSLNFAKNKLNTMLAEEIAAELALAQSSGAPDAYILANHGKCTEWCCFREAGRPDNWQTFKDNAATVTKFLTEPFGVEDVYGMINEGIEAGNESKKAE